MLKKAQILKIGKTPMVVLPISLWKNIEERALMLEEYYQMSHSAKYKKDIAAARASKKTISSEKLYKKLGIA